MAISRRRTRSFGRSKRPVYWDTFSLTQAKMPQVIVTNGTLIDGAFSAYRRYEGVTDRTIRRTIIDITGEVFQLDFQVSSAAVLELCIGIGMWDSSADVEGEGNQTPLLPGTGPLTDADNSRWMIRCCIQIPIGTATQWGSTENIGPVPAGPHAYWYYTGGTAATGGFGFGCHFDTKVMRKMHGLNTQWLNLALEASISPTPAVGDDITAQINGFGGRMLLSNAR